MTRVVFAPLAEADLEAIWDCIARDKPRPGVTFAAKVRKACERL